MRPPPSQHRETGDSEASGVLSYTRTRARPSEGRPSRRGLFFFRPMAIVPGASLASKAGERKSPSSSSVSVVAEST